MKKGYLLLPILAITGFALFLSQKTPPKSVPSEAQNIPLETPVVSPTPIETLPVTVTPLVSGDQVSLIANYTDKKTSEELLTEHSCLYLVNGGFYTKEETPVGYVKTNTTELGRVRDSLLFDGFLTVNAMSTPRITRSLPTDTLTLALQTGPILIENGKEVTLSIKNDKEARRVFALITGDNQILFGMVLSSTLEHLPNVIFSWAKAHSVAVADVINLDGGSASAYRGPNGIYPEISPIGSAFCIKQ